MAKSKIYWSVWIHLGLGVLGFTAVLVILTWLLHQYWILQKVSLGDALFIMGALACATASAGLMRNPSSEMLGPWGVTAEPVQTSEEEKRVQRIAYFVERRSFGVRLLISGLLTILISILVVYAFRI